LAASSRGPILIEEEPTDGLSTRFSAKVRGYFAGERVQFDEPIDLSRASVFDRRVLEVVHSIPVGEVRSYAWVALQIDRPKAARPVGQAVGRNPIPIIVPCHRVIGSDGGLRGFGWGLEFKKWLLDLEKLT
jgi:methylated-DNA-[protein]-cysteine S-methyltransferase